jgi:hypothetical protein
MIGDPLPPALALIGSALLIEPKRNLEILGEIADALGGDAKELLDPFGELWTALCEFDEPLDPIAFMARCPAWRELIRRILAGSESIAPGSWPDYLDTLRRDRRKRVVSLELLKAQELLASGADPGPLLHRVTLLNEGLSAASRPPRTRKDMMLEFVADLKRREDLRKAGKLTGIPTGIGRLDRSIDGLQPGEFSVLGARPSMGKTAFGLAIATHTALTLEVPTLYIALESTSKGLIRRMASCFSGAEASDLKYGDVSRWEKHLVRFQAAFMKAPFDILDHVNHPAVRNIDGAVAAARGAIRRNGVQLVVVDYLQKMTGTEGREEMRLEVAEVSGKLAALAQGAGVHVMALAQLKRESEKKDHPTLADLAESGHIERDADLVLLLHREDRRNENADLIVAKQRDGALDIVPLRFDLKRQRFEDRREQIDHSAR